MTQDMFSLFKASQKDHKKLLCDSTNKLSYGQSIKANEKDLLHKEGSQGERSSVGKESTRMYLKDMYNFNCTVLNCTFKYIKGIVCSFAIRTKKIKNTSSTKNTNNNNSTITTNNNITISNNTTTTNRTNTNKAIDTIKTTKSKTQTTKDLVEKESLKKRI